LISYSYQRVYKTGDLVTLDSDGNYIFLGRKDFMIKSRGYRIEIGQVESVILSHSLVKEAVVIPVADELIGNRITAAIVSLPSKELTKSDIVNYCSSQLPRYMIPEVIDFRDSLPKNSSGKTDRKKLTKIMSQMVSRI
jgi:acyl-coenzyme A synthetase/AMP-(fatty) acid ligase